MRKTGIAAALLLLGLSQAALAENRAETVTFAPYVGGYTFQGNQHVETSPVFGFRLGYNLTDHWALEGVIDYLKTEGTKKFRNWQCGNAALRWRCALQFYPQEQLCAVSGSWFWWSEIYYWRPSRLAYCGKLWRWCQVVHDRKCCPAGGCPWVKLPV